MWSKGHDPRTLILNYNYMRILSHAKLWSNVPFCSNFLGSVWKTCVDLYIFRNVEILHSTTITECWLHCIQASTIFSHFFILKRQINRELPSFELWSATLELVAKATGPTEWEWTATAVTTFFILPFSLMPNYDGMVISSAFWASRNKIC